MKILILGGTGFIGSYLAEFLENKDHQVTAIGRKAFSEDFDLAALLKGQELLINLSGANIGQRWTPQYKNEIVNSRIKTAEKLQTALKQTANGPKRIFSASAIGIYPENDCAHPWDESYDTQSALQGESFLTALGQAWEQASLAFRPRPVILRFGVVLGKGGGALAKMLPAFKWGLGGPVAGGKQCFSWIHIEDLARVVLFLMERPELEGAFNLTAPTPVSNVDFGKTLAKQLRRPFLLPLPLWQLKLMFGEGAQVLTYSSAVLPARLLKNGFQFQYHDCDKALKNILTP
jgi:uncharacterized protein (TIGR01777 family)